MNIHREIEPPRIICGKCNKLVDTVEWYRSPHRMGTVVTVTCHGEQERGFIADEQVANGDKFTGGVAFRSHKIDEVKKLETNLNQGV